MLVEIFFLLNFTFLGSKLDSNVEFKISKLQIIKKLALAKIHIKNVKILTFSIKKGNLI